MGAVPDVLNVNGQRYEMGVFNREPFWHRIGEVWTPPIGQEQDILALHEAIRLANLNDLDYRTQTTYTEVNGQFVEVPDSLAVTRIDPTNRDRREYISAVGKRTHMFQIEQLGEFAETILEIGAPDGVEVEALFQMNNGKMTVYVFRIPEHLEVGGDQIARYLLVVDYYDGSGAVIVKIVNIRVGCANTLAVGLAEKTSMFTIPHSQWGLDMRIQWARESLSLNLKTDPLFVEQVESLINRFVVEEKFNEIVHELIPDVPVIASDRQKNTVLRKRRQVQAVYDGPTVDQFRGTAWGVLNAFTEAQQWAPGSRTSDLSLAKRQASPQTLAYEKKVLRAIDKVLVG